MGHWLPQTDEKLARERLAQVFRVTACLVWGNGSPKFAELFNQTEVAQLSVCLAHQFYVLGERIHQTFLRVEDIPSFSEHTRVPIGYRVCRSILRCTNYSFFVEMTIFRRIHTSFDCILPSLHKFHHFRTEVWISANIKKTNRSLTCVTQTISQCSQNVDVNGPHHWTVWILTQSNAACQCVPTF